MSTGYTLEDGYKSEENKKAYPSRALFPGAKSGLHVELRSLEKNLEYQCGNSLQGYKILLHHPAEIPRVSQQYFRLPLNQAVVTALTPEMISTTIELQGYDPEKRQCYFQKERNLTFFKIYTQKNCEVECLRNYMHDNCGCVDFHMPLENDTTICGPKKLACMRRAETILLLKEVEDFLEEKQKSETDNKEGTFTKILDKALAQLKMKKVLHKNACNCFPSCTSITYSAETSQTEWHWQKTMKEDAKADERGDAELEEHRSMLTVYFKDTQFIPSERDELFGTTDFLASCGGLVSLFIGFSFISLVEIIYFLSLRLCCNIRLYGKKYWYGSNSD